MQQFIAKLGEKIQGVLCGFDRIVFRGELRALYIPGEGGMQQYLKSSKILLKDFGEHVQQVSQRLKRASLATALELGRVVQYLAPSADKAAVARRLVREQGIQNGLICVLSSVEPCQSFRTVPNRKLQQLELKLERRQCLHLYHYWMHPVLGFMNARIQTWFPFRIQICLNGREWLAQQMQAAGVKYVRQDNCFPWIEDFAQAQQLMDEQLQQNWPQTLQALAHQLNPIHEEIFQRYRVNYYWTTRESEWAIDLRFARAEDLRRLYPLLVQHGITTFSSSDVLRFLGKRVPLQGQLPPGYEGEIWGNVKERVEGIRIKHYLDSNSLKLYDKAFTPVGNLLRAEATMNCVDSFKVYRPREGGGEKTLAWRGMRRSVADLHARAELSHKAAGRYLDALASLDDSTRLYELTEGLEQPTRWKQKRVRGLRVFGEDRALLETISRGEFNLNGFRNRDLRIRLYGASSDSPDQIRRCSATISRKLRLLRAHKLIKKLPHTHRYALTEFGRLAITAILAARQATVSQLTKAA